MTTITVPTAALIGQLGWLRARPRLLFGGLALALLLVASTLGRPWLEALGIGSAGLSLLPCAAMCATGLCMNEGGTCAKRGDTDGDVARPGSDVT